MIYIWFTYPFTRCWYKLHHTLDYLVHTISACIAFLSASLNTATERIPSRWAVRITLHAISPRLATRSLSNSWWDSPDRCLHALTLGGRRLWTHHRDLGAIECQTHLCRCLPGPTRGSLRHLMADMTSTVYVRVRNGFDLWPMNLNHIVYRNTTASYHWPSHAQTTHRGIAKGKQCRLALSLLLWCMKLTTGRERAIWYSDYKSRCITFRRLPIL